VLRGSKPKPRNGHMARAKRRIEEWFDLASVVLSDETWDVKLQRSEGSLAHRPSPWGGYLLRMDLRRIPVKNCPEPASLFVRPEVRCLHRQDLHPGLWQAELACLEAPGAAVVRHREVPEANVKELLGPENPHLRLTFALFGDIGAPAQCNFFGIKGPEVIRQQIWRNFPQEGDTTGFAYHQEAHPQ
ncbi:unnamed protein product, partial [Effrenium voratum]